MSIEIWVLLGITLLIGISVGIGLALFLDATEQKTEVKQDD